MTSQEENSRITKAEQVLFEEFIKDLEQTAAQVQLLLTILSLIKRSLKQIGRFLYQNRG